MKLTVTIVLFCPDLVVLKRNILSIIEDVDFIALFLNSPIPEKWVEEVLPPILTNKIVILGTGVNLGIATALNTSAKWALSNESDYLLSLDQDSYFRPGELSKYKDLVENYKSKIGIGIFGPNINNRGSLLYDSKNDYLQVAETITSGCIYPIEIFSEGHYFEDALFIDAVDYEFCYRLEAKYGINTIVFPQACLQHEVGEALKSLWGFKTDNYSAFRTYFILRNQLIIWKRYPKHFSRSYKRTYIHSHLIGRIIKILLAEKDKYSKLKAIIVGIIHGFQGRTGFYKIK